MSNLIPVSDEQAKAIREGIKALRDVGSFLTEVVGTAPAHLVGYYLGSDWLRVRRAENLARMIEEAKERLDKWKSARERPSMSVALPLLIAAADESRDELREIWARLLAAAVDSVRAKSFRIQFIDTASKLDPIDAIILDAAQSVNGPVTGGTTDEWAKRFKIRKDEIEISLQNLSRLQLLSSIGGHYIVTPLGREFLRAISD